MMTGKRKWALAGWMGLILALAVFLNGPRINPPQAPVKPVTGSLAQVAQDAGQRGKLTVRYMREYLKCGHLVTEGTGEMAPEELWELLEEKGGVRMQEAGDQALVIETEDAFCPADANKRSLGIAGDYLAIFKGPAAQGEIEKVTQIRVEQLPEEWRELLARGALEFHDETSLLEALDSLDEYQS